MAPSGQRRSGNRGVGARRCGRTSSAARRKRRAARRPPRRPAPGPTIPPELPARIGPSARSRRGVGRRSFFDMVPGLMPAFAGEGSGMDRIRICGGQRLNGAIPISGAKNATLPLMIASLLTDKTLILDNVPRLADVNLLQRILGNHGVDIMVSGKRVGETQYDGQTLHVPAANILDTTAPYELVSRMRASFWA